MTKEEYLRSICDQFPGCDGCPFDEDGCCKSAELIGDGDNFDAAIEFLGGKGYVYVP